MSVSQNVYVLFWSSFSQILRLHTTQGPSEAPKVYHTCVFVGNRWNISRSITRKWAILQKLFYWFINNCTFLFSADSICYILWCDSEGLLHFAPFYLLVGNADRIRSTVYKPELFTVVFTSTWETLDLIICVFLLPFPPSSWGFTRLCASPRHGRPNIFQEYW